MALNDPKDLSKQPISGVLPNFIFFMRPYLQFSSMITNKIIEFINQRGLLKMYTFGCPPESRLVLLDHVIKINATMYTVKPFCRQYKSLDKTLVLCTFQQDFSPSHKTRVNHEWLRKLFHTSFSARNCYWDCAKTTPDDGQRAIVFGTSQCQYLR